MGFYIIRILQFEFFPSPIVFCITLMSMHMNMDRLMFAREEHKHKTIMSK